MSSHNEIEERFGDLVRELRSGNAEAPDSLRERVRAIAAQAPDPRPARPPFGERFRFRRVALVLVPACVVAAAGAALLHGLTSSGSKPVATNLSADQPAARSASGRDGGTMQRLAPLSRPATPPTAKESAAAPPPAGGRYQDYRVTMRVRVTGLDALSTSVVKAMRVTRALGGYVASVEYSSPSTRHGDAVLVLRVPVGNVQKAVLSYAGLGSLVAQHFSVVDLQRRYDAQVQGIADLRALVAKLQARLVGGGLSDLERAHTLEQIEYSRAKLTRLTAENRTTLNRARLSTARLSLTTFHKQQKQLVPAAPTRLDRTLGDAGRVLAQEAIWFLYALLVAGPFVLLALMALAAERSRRRRSDRRLLAATR